MNTDKTPFTKILDSEKFGQITLLKNDSNDDGHPALEIYFRLPGLGINKMSLGFTDPDEDVAFTRLDEAFVKVNLEQAESIVQNTYDDLAKTGLFDDED